MSERSAKRLLRRREKQFWKEHRIKVKGYYNFYAVPWDASLYIKFPSQYITLSNIDYTSYGFSIHDDAYDQYTEKNEERRSNFWKDNYLGSARLKDKIRLKGMLGKRKELKLNG